MPATTVNAISSSTSLYLKLGGMTYAAASVTTPRMPAQPTRRVPCQVGGRPVAGSGPGRTSSHLEMNTQTIRSTITPIRVVTHTSTMRPAETSLSWTSVNSSRAWRPIRRKTVFSRM